MLFNVHTYLHNRVIERNIGRKHIQVTRRENDGEQDLRLSRQPGARFGLPYLVEQNQDREEMAQLKRKR
jgi:hypothetical protein